MAMDTETFKGPDLFGYLVRPEGPPAGTVLILPTIFGINEFARGFADLLAGEGLAAVVWDINSGLPPVTDYQECIRRARTLTDRGVAVQIGEWLNKLEVDFAGSRLGVIGFCIGGRFALVAAAEDQRLRCCAAAYPSIESPRLSNQEVDAIEAAGRISCPVHILQPGNDHVTSPPTYQQLKQKLLSRRAPTIVQTYPEAEHGFMHRDKPEANPAATKLASPQVVAFLKSCLS
jgi:carboxymethylenebutenolidase